MQSLTVETQKLERQDIPTSIVWLFSLIVVILSICYFRIQQDDSYIFYTYARNIAEGNGYVFNIGNRFNGTTSALYTLLLASAYRAFGFVPGMTLPVIGHLIGGICLWVTAFFGARALQRRGFSTAAIVFPFWFLSNPYLRNGAGMESYLTLALIVLAVSAYQEDRWHLTSACCALAVLSRPDSILLAALLLTHYGLTRRRLPSATSFLLFGIIVLPWYLFSYFYFGEVLPSTIATKVGQTQSGLWGEGSVFLHGLLKQMAWPHREALPLSVLCIASIAVIVRNWRRSRSSTFANILLVWTALYLATYILINPPDYPWYYTPLALGMALLLALGSEAVLRKRHATQAIALAFVLAAIALLLPIQTRRKEYPNNLVRYRAASDWLNAHASNNASVGADEIGVLGYFYRQGSIVDGLGLVTPGVAAHVKRKDFDWYVHQYHPDYLMFHQPAWPGFEDMVREPWFIQQYYSAAAIENRGGDLTIFKRRGGEIK